VISTEVDHSLEFAGGRLGRHRHICAFFDGLDEQHRVLRSFIKDGFDRREKAFHIVDPELWEEHLKRLGEAGIDVDEAMGSGQLEVRPWEDAQLREGRFDQHAMLALIEEVLQSGPAAGYSLTRFLTSMDWALLDKPGVEDLLETEARFNYVAPKLRRPGDLRLRPVEGIQLPRYRRRHPDAPSRDHRRGAAGEPILRSA
jgi:hypothetical protein